ncbi:MAG TPA: DUF5668 domain-containing protein [Acidobacteriota bacterium]|jgi:hypothetical protein|nr:hypothetical protein [Acidobacteriota bacterium]HNR40031.1 DUF5668 domain-containing protein [Acidobacteriota bacterium]HNT99878.1 DUF5668 domain-containing protein [Acidobacteriota bacterium]
MNCHYHPDQAATAACALCQRELCPACQHAAEGGPLCPECLKQAVQCYQRSLTPEYRAINPVASAWLALIPFLGAIYNGTYFRALSQFLGMALLILLFDAADLGPLGALGSILFYVYTIIDAYRVASRMKAGLLDGSTPDLVLTPRTKLFYGVGLVVLGLLFLLRNFELFDFDWLHRLWPLLLIGVGAYMVWKGFEKLKSGPAPTAAPAAAPRIPVEPPASTEGKQS